jgi:hypothetical protein
LVRGNETIPKTPLDGSSQEISSSDLFGNDTCYPIATVCEYRFCIENSTTVEVNFTKIDLETSDTYCNKTDYIAINVQFADGKPNRFCGKQLGHVNRVIRGEDIPLVVCGRRELIITFRADSSVCGDGFSGSLKKIDP